MGRRIRSGWLALLVTGAGALAASPLRVCDSQVPPSSLNPHTILEWKPEVLMSHVYDGLLGFDPEGEILPRLAVEWEWLSPRRLRLHLRRGVRFHDGSSFDAGVVRWNFETMRALGEESARSFLFDSVRDVEVADPRTVDLLLSRPDGTLLHKLAAFSPMVPVRPVGSEAWERLAREPVGTGPYRFGRWSGQGDLVLVPHEAHFNGPPAFSEGMVFCFLPEREQVTRLLAGELDLVASVRPFFLGQVAASPRCRLVEAESLVAVDMLFNTRSPRAGDRRVRRAVVAALNIPDLVRYVARSKARAICGGGLPGQLGRTPEGPCPRFDPDLSRRLLAELPGGGRVALRGLLDPEFRLLGKSLQVQLAKVGIRLELEEVDREELHRRVARAEKSGDGSWGGDLYVYSCPDPTYHYFFVNRIGLHGQGPWSLWQSAEYDARFLRMEQAQAPEEVREHCRELDRIVAREVPRLRLYQVRRAYGVSRRMDFCPTRSGMLDLRHSRLAPPAGRGRSQTGTVEVERIVRRGQGSAP